MAAPGILGTVAPGFEGAAEAFAEGFRSRGELGASAAAIVGGRVVLDVHAGTAADGRPWAADTIVNAYSVGKAFAAVCALILVDRGRIGLDDPVASVWPEFAAAGKGGLTLRHVLAHQAGLDLAETPPSVETLTDWGAMTRLLAAAAPRYAPGTRHAEHASTYGHLVGEILRRVDGRTLGRFLRDEVAGPWRLDFHVGLDAGERARAADIADPDGMATTPRPDPPGAQVSPYLDPRVVNGEQWRAAEVPAVNGHGTALAVARLYAGLAAGGVLDGVRILSAAAVAEMLRAQLTGFDDVVGSETTWALGVQVDEDGWGMGGVGGNAGWWGEPGYAFGYVTRRLGDHERALAVDAAVRAAVAAA